MLDWPGQGWSGLSALLFSALELACTTGQCVHPRALEHVRAGAAYLSEAQCELAEQRCALAVEYGAECPEAHNCLGIAEIICRADHGAAARHFKRALAINPDFAEAHNNLAACFLEEIPPDYPAADDELRAALEIDPAYLDARQNLAESLLRQAILADERGAREEQEAFLRAARDQLVRLLEMAPERASAHGLLGLEALTRGDPAEAARRFGDCLSLRPEEEECLLGLGRAELTRGRCREAQVPWIKGARRRGPRAPEFALGLREAQAQCAAEDRALAVFVERIRLEPGVAEHHHALAGVYRERGMLSEAEAEWESALKLAPELCAVHAALIELADQALDGARMDRRCAALADCRGPAPEPEAVSDARQRCRRWWRSEAEGSDDQNPVPVALPAPVPIGSEPIGSDPASISISKGRAGGR